MTDSMKAADYSITGLYLRNFLSGLRTTSGSHYERLLEQSGLGQFSQKYPPPTTQVVAKGRQLITLIKLIDETLGGGFELFSHNHSRHYARNSAQVAAYREGVGAIGDVAEYDNLARLIELSVKINSQTIDEVILIEKVENPKALKLIYKECLYCAERGPLTRPSCNMISVFYRQLVLDLTGRRWQMEETFCGAMHGKPDCHFLMQR